jgi:transcriptional regulator with XRE-family HTH domain
MPVFIDSMDVTPQIKAYQINVTAFRLEKGWTPEELARAVKVSPAHVTNLEAGRSAGSIHLLIRIARALGVSLDRLMTPNE